MKFSKTHYCFDYSVYGIDYCDKTDLQGDWVEIAAATLLYVTGDNNNNIAK